MSTVPLSALPATWGLASTPLAAVATRSTPSVHTAAPSNETSTTDAIARARDLHQRGADAAGEVRAARCVAERAARHHERRAVLA